jgi:KaiC/GvpD/RAD55 family RecA-like ATPase
MHLTLWLNHVTPDGAHTTVPWEEIVSFVARPIVHEDKPTLPGWSPAKFVDSKRSKANVEAISLLVLDLDETSLTLEGVAGVFAGVSGIVHTTHSSTPEKPKYRIILRLTRDVSAAEHALVWTHVHALCLEQNVSLDTTARDASRLFYVPAKREDAVYDWRDLPGEPLPVDELLASAPIVVPPTSAAPAAATTVASRYAAAARLLASAWPAPGARHEAKRALAGALWHARATREEAESFLREVYKHVVPAPVDAHIGAVVGSTWAAGESGGNVEGWATLATRVDVGIVQAARDLRAFGALEERHARLESVESRPASFRSAVERALKVGSSATARLATGYPTLDSATRGGLLARKLVVIGGAPGAGKTGMLVCLAYKWLLEGICVGFLAADEDAEGILIRLGQMAGLSRDALENGDKTARAVLADWCRRVPFLIADGDEGVSIEDMSAHIRQQRSGPSALLVDSIQTARTNTVHGKTADRREKIDAAVTALKYSAKVDEHLVAASSELSRGAYRSKAAAENSNMLAAFKDSGAIEYGVSLAIGLESRAGSSDLVDASVVKNRLGHGKPTFLLRLEHGRADVKEIPIESIEARESGIEDRIEEILTNSGGAPIVRNELYRRIGGRRQTVFQAVKQMLEMRKITEDAKGGVRLPLPDEPGYTK